MLSSLPFLAQAQDYVPKPAFLHQMWVAEKSVYVLEYPDFAPHTAIRQFKVTAKGVQQTGKPFLSKEFIVGTGPGLGDSLLLLCKTSETAYKLLRLANGSIRKVGDLKGFYCTLDPEIEIKETRDCIEVDDPDTQGDVGGMRIWLYHGALVGPMRTDLRERKQPINALITYSVEAATGGSGQTVNLYVKESGFWSGSFSVSNRTLRLDGAIPDGVEPIMTTSHNATTLIVSKDQKDWLAVADHTDEYPNTRHIQIWKPIGKDTVGGKRDLPNDGFTIDGRIPIFADTYSRVWIWSKGHVFKQVPLKLVRTETVKGW